MWGCNDESVVSIAAALHATYACPQTRHLDLDGSFDLGRDPATGGFVVGLDLSRGAIAYVNDGRLQVLNRPGLGVELSG